MKRTRKLRVFIVGMLVASFCLASNVLDQGLGLKGMQVAGAYTAAPAGPEALYWNIGSLAQTNTPALYFSGGTRVMDGSDVTGLISIPFGEWMVLGAGLLRSQVDQIAARDSAGNLLGSLTLQDEVAIVGISIRTVEFLSIGFAAKSSKTELTSQTPKTIKSLDLGTNLDLGLLAIGCVVQDAISDQFQNTPIYRTGIKIIVGDLQLRTDLEYRVALDQSFTRYGLVFSGIPSLLLKGGYSTYDQQIFGGLSCQLATLEFDYLLLQNDLGMDHRFGLGFRF